MLLRGERIGANDALQAGMVDEIVPDQDLAEAVAERAKSISPASVGALAESKVLLSRPGLREAVAHAIEATLRCQETPAHAAALEAFLSRTNARKSSSAADTHNAITALVASALPRKARSDHDERDTSESTIPSIRSG